MATIIIAQNEAFKKKSHLENLLEQISQIELPKLAQRRGRPFLYSPEQVIASFVVMLYLHLDSLRSLGRVLQNSQELALACGFRKKVPCWKTFARRFKTLDKSLCDMAKAIASKLIDCDQASKKVVTIDSTILEAKGTPAQNSNPNIIPTDKDASWGFSNTRGWIYGYKLHLTSTVGEVIIPLTWEITGANVHDSTQFGALTQDLYQTKHFLGDDAYDSKDLYQLAEKQGGRLTTPVRRFKNLSLERQELVCWYESDLGRQLFKRRGDIERLFGTLKDVFEIDPLPVVGKEAVTTYLGIAIVAYLIGVYHNCLVGRPKRAIKSIAR